MVRLQGLVSAANPAPKNGSKDGFKDAKDSKRSEVQGSHSSTRKFEDFVRQPLREARGSRLSHLSFRFLHVCFLVYGSVRIALALMAVDSVLLFPLCTRLFFFSLFFLCSFGALSCDDDARL
ncbi:hypothetical protein BJ508DRAFT_111789 [Ascobolus immersus RN42]|uniref:Transmembrane protein n=1 Tax=Ascobolus immersus RN42 TaxID=1160509 RepID=A0A3N4HMZ1_ASCIM|nr:hypothetical protein BJ508DRAFT_111789 [Ascobolus immersus RN42]